MARRSELSLAGAGAEALCAERYAPDLASGPRPGLLLVHGCAPPDEFVRGLAGRLVSAGYVVFVPHLEPEGDRRALERLDAATAAVQADEAVDGERVAAFGVGDGGRLAFLLGCRSRRLAAVVDFQGQVRYARLDAQRPVQPLEMALGLECPLLAVFGAEDPGTPPADVEGMRAHLSAFAKPFEIDVVPGVGQDLLDPRRAGHHAAAAEQAWARALAFLEENL